MIAETTRIQLAILLPVTGAWSTGSRVAGAAALAVEQVNADKTLLPGQRMVYSWADTGCSETQGLKAIVKLLRGKDRVNAVIGPGSRQQSAVVGGR